MKSVDLKKYIGRDYSAYNCFDLVKEFYMDHYGIKVSDYYEGETPCREEVESLIVSNKGDFVSVDSPKFGDIVTIKLYGIECHVGVCISDKLFLHSVKTIGSCMDNISKYKRMITGFHRHRDVTND